MTAGQVYHVVEAARWERAMAEGGLAVPAGAAFLHCCTAAQLEFVLRRHFAGRTGLVLLCLDPARLRAPLRWERSEPDQEPFPHLYGPLPVEAVESVRPLA